MIQHGRVQIPVTDKQPRANPGRVIGWCCVCSSSADICLGEETEILAVIIYFLKYELVSWFIQDVTCIYHYFLVSIESYWHRELFPNYLLARYFGFTVHCVSFLSATLFPAAFFTRNILTITFLRFFLRSWFKAKKKKKQIKERSCQIHPSKWMLILYHWRPGSTFFEYICFLGKS